MIELYFAALLMAVAIAALCSYAMSRAAKNQPLLQDTAAQRDSDNLALFDIRQRELDSSLASGQIDADTHALLLGEATSQLLTDTGEANAEKKAGARTASSLSPAPVLLGICVTPLIALALYQSWGLSLGADDQWQVRQQLIAINQMTDGKTPRQLQDHSALKISLDKLVDTLESHALNRFADEELLVLLLQMYRSANELPKSETVLRRLLDANSDSAQLQTELAEVIYLRALSKKSAKTTANTPAKTVEQPQANPGQLTTNDYKQVDTLLKQALTTDPQSAKALSLAGMSAFQQADYSAALGYWRRALQELPAGSSQSDTIRRGVQAVLNVAGDEVINSSISAWVDINVSIELPAGNSDAGDIDANTPVFVFARAETGPPMPLAARRLTLAELPARIRLSDLDQMAALGLDSASSVRVQARLSRSGQPTGQPGDFQSAGVITQVLRRSDGASPAERVSEVQLVIDQPVE